MTGPWARPSGVVADLVRLAALVSAVAAWPAQPREAVLRFLLVFAILLATRWVGIPRPFDAVFGLLLLSSAWFSALQWYREHPWIDIPVHFALPGTTAAVLYIVLARQRLVPQLPARDLRGRAAVVLATALLGCAVALVWELYEWVVQQYVPSEILVGYTDTVGDLAMGLLGSIAAGLAVAWWELTGHPLRTRADSRNTTVRHGEAS